MKLSRLAPLVLAMLLHFAPLAARVAQSVPTLAAAPAAIVLKWVAGALAVAGAYHTVSAATGLVSASTVQGKTGVRLTYQIKLTGREVGIPLSWLLDGSVLNSPGSTTRGMPPGLSFSLTTGIISGVPTKDGTFVVPVTAFENKNGGGGKLPFTLTFVIAASVSPPAITTQPAGSSVHVGEPLTLSVAASGGGSFAYQWKHNGADVPGGNAAVLTVDATAASDAGDYQVLVTNAAGSATSALAKVVVVPLSIGISLSNDHTVSLRMETIPGRRYAIEAADVLNSSAWSVAAEIVAGTSSEVFGDLATQAAQRFWRYRPVL